MDGPWTTRKLLAWTTRHFEDRGVDSPRVAAEMLLGHVLGVERLRLYMEPDRPASPDERDTFRGLVARAGRHEPVDYLIGKAPFFSLELAVSPAVLVPRPSTETIVEYVLQRERQTSRDDLAIADVCTGSGAIAVALAKHLPAATFVATDLSEDALAVARQNAEAHGVADRIDFRHGDLLAPLDDQRFDYLLSNPPYISDAEWVEVPANVKDYEPTMALRGGVDGLDCLRPLVAGAAEHMLAGAEVLLEFAASQAEAVVGLVESADGVGGAGVLDDHERLPRVVVFGRV